MQTVSQQVQRHANSYARTLVRQTVQPGTLQNVLEQEIHAILSEVFQNRMDSEYAEATGRDRYERSADAPWRNGTKPVIVPGLAGPMTLHRPVPRNGSVRLPVLEALKTAGKHLRDVLAVRFWLRGASTRAVADELHAALGARIGKSTVSKLTETIEPTVAAWEERPVPAGIQYVLLDALYQSPSSPPSRGTEYVSSTETKHPLCLSIKLLRRPSKALISCVALIYPGDCFHSLVPA